MKALKRVLGVVVALVLALGLFNVTVNADPIKETDPDNPPQVGLTKTVSTGKGTVNVPELTYKFNITQITNADDEYAKIKDGAVGSTVTYTVKTDRELKILGGATQVKPTTATPSKTTATTDTYSLESANFFDKDEYISQIPVYTDSPAIFAYRITEKAELDASELAAWGGVDKGNGLYVKEDDNAREELQLSKAEYVMYVYTKTVPNSNPQKAYISAVTVKQIKYTDGTPADPGDAKKDPTLGGDPTVDGDFSQLEFVNTFTKTKKDPPYTSDKSYELVKRVTGVDQDPEAYKTPFKFGVTVTLPAGAPTTADTLIAKYYKSDNGSTWVETGDTVEFQDGVATEVTLHHNERIAFDNLPVGTTVTSVENDYYKANPTNKDGDYSYKVSVNGKALLDDDANLSETNRREARTFTTSVTEDGAKVVYENNGSTGTTPTGILMNYLPFFVIILLAVVALVGTAVVKGSRKATSC